MDYTQSGDPKVHFNLVDSNGTYLICCAMLHNTTSKAIKELQEVVFFYGAGRKPIGRLPGMMYLMKEASIVPFGTPRIVTQPKCQILEITCSNDF